MAQLSAGEGLDILAAHRVMGGFSGVGDIQVYTVHGVQYISEHEKIRVGIPRYSTEVAAAWEVVEKFAEGATRRDVYPTIWWDKVGDYWSCELGGKYLGTGNTAPLAICLAALKAMDG